MSLLVLSLCTAQVFMARQEQLKKLAEQDAQLLKQKIQLANFREAILTNCDMTTPADQRRPFSPHDHQKLQAKLNLEAQIRRAEKIKTYREKTANKMQELARSQHVLQYDSSTARGMNILFLRFSCTVKSYNMQRLLLPAAAAAASMHVHMLCRNLNGTLAMLQDPKAAVKVHHDNTLFWYWAC